MLKFLTCLIQLITSPAKGWEDIAAVGEEPRKICSDGFYPLLGVTACSVFICRLYDADLGIATLIQGAIITFVKYFVSYFLASFLFAIFLGKVVDGEPNEKKYHTFALYNISLLALIKIISNCLPTELSIVQFLPLFTIVVMWMGRRYLAVREERSFTFIFIASVAILVMPYVLEILFNKVIPYAN